MARSRNIKPGFFTNDVLCELPPLARILFAGLWCHADREGRLEDRPKKLKAEILPYDSCDVDGLVQCLHSAGMVLRYSVDNIKYIQVIHFTKHQNPHVKEAPSVIPAPGLHSASTGNSGTSPADSLLLIPDSLNPSSTLSGNSETSIPEKQKKRKNGAKAHNLEALEILSFLNDKAGRRYQPTRSNMQFIQARLADGATVIECRQVIAKKCREWLQDPEMSEFLRPATLFNATKFSQYQGELGVPDAETSEIQ
jgi:uncharacterized phage protein (TIGR02220 family)